MKKRIKKKKTKKRYLYGIQLLSYYCELSKGIVVKEVGRNLWEVAKQFNRDKDDDELSPYLDSVSISLMQKYQTGWVGRTSSAETSKG